MDLLNSKSLKETTIEHTVTLWWIRKSFWAVMDQGLFATSNFFLNILLARWLVPQEYGVFTVAYTTFLFLSTFHTGMINEPMLVFGPGKYKGKIRAYLQTLILGSWILGILVGIVFLIVFLAFLNFSNSNLTPTLLVISIASPLILFQWLMRKACYINLQPQLAAFAGFGYMALIFTGAFGLNYYEQLRPITVLFIMAIAHLFSGLWLFFKLRIHFNIHKDKELMVDVFNNHWKYGKWASGTAALSWIPCNVFILFLPLWNGLEASAAYKALINLVLPILHVITASGTVMLPILVEKRGLKEFRRLIIYFSFPYILGPILYLIFIRVFGDSMIHILYNGKYIEYVNLLWLIGIIPIIFAMVNLSVIVLQALELPYIIFRAHIISSVIVFTLGLLFVKVWGVYGAMVGWLIAYLAIGSILFGKYALIKLNSTFNHISSKIVNL